MPLSRRLPVLLSITALGTALSACQSDRPVSGPNRAALPTMERVALAANTCWFKSGDAAFRPYRLAPELNSFSGRPRILAVPRNSPESRPMLVVQAEGNPARLDAFGPMMSGPEGERIKRDVLRWASGTSSC
ncbi:hypothetical protein [Rhizobium terrae]|uniref:hypothetical protein n=1 Tax=Rhizobium terrae TaxID=2171756 RepID=UPI000E3C36F0|nr:hypothetical protein [Rhizobium terrae]